MEFWNVRHKADVRALVAYPKLESSDHDEVRCIVIGGCRCTLYGGEGRCAAMEYKEVASMGVFLFGATCRKLFDSRFRSGLARVKAPSTLAALRLHLIDREFFSSLQI